MVNHLDLFMLWLLNLLAMNLLVRGMYRDPIFHLISSFRFEPGFNHQGVHCVCKVTNRHCNQQDHKKNAKISYISLAECARLANFILRGSLPNLEELDLSHTSVKMLELGEVVEVGNLQRVFCGMQAAPLNFMAQNRNVQTKAVVH